MEKVGNAAAHRGNGVSDGTGTWDPVRTIVAPGKVDGNVGRT